MYKICSGVYMIALNELLKNIDSYNSAYELMGLKTNLNNFVVLENKLKNVQLQFEHTRALCNKKCGELIQLKIANNNVDDLLNEITLLDKTANKLQKQLNIITNIINKKLRKLHNLPDNTNTHHLQIETSKTKSNFNNLKSFLEKFCKIDSTVYSNKKYISKQAEKLFNEEELPIATYTKKGITLLCTKNDLDNVYDKLLNYFKQNSLSIIERSVAKLKKSSTRELFIHLNHKTYLKLEVKKEFYSREYKIKYRDKECDMTKFVNQINIIF